jgi:hypothetical protein
MALLFEMFNDDTFKVQTCMITANMDSHGAILSKKEKTPTIFGGGL